MDVSSIKQLGPNLAAYISKETGEIVPQLFDEGMGSQTWFRGSVMLCGICLLDRMWTHLGLSKALKIFLKNRKYGILLERLIISMIANSALAPSSKQHLEHWVAHEVYIEELSTVDSQNLYRIIDFLQEHAEVLQKAVFHSVADLFNLEVDLLFINTTTTYFDVEGEDATTLNPMKPVKNWFIWDIVVGAGMARTTIQNWHKWCLLCGHS